MTLNFMSGIEKKKEKMIERAIIITDKNSGM
jgi:oligoribonuclease (3'-5' exoribonuclease)